MGYFFLQHNADSADFITRFLHVFLSCLEKGKKWTEFRLKSALVPWFGKMALRSSAEITSLIPFVTLHKSLSQSWPDILTAMSSVYHFFSSWKILSCASAPQNTSPARCFDLSLGAQNSGNFRKHLLIPTSFFYLETETKQKLMS